MSITQHLKEVRAIIRSDIQAVFDRDPAARSTFEVVLTYSGLHAIWMYRIAHWFYNRKWFLVARIISQIARFLTGIEIHPGAKIGRGFFIDHGMGVVIGETCEIGDHVTIYQGVTLGGTGKEKGKRHPTVEDGVLIASGAKVLGSMRIGRYSKIGAGSVVLREVPPNSTVVGVPGRVVVQDGVRIRSAGAQDLDQVNLPDPVAETCSRLEAEIERLQARLHDLTQEMETIREEKNKDDLARIQHSNTEA
ncbi:MAG: serine O-acetyltransferase [Firmicutes bacterium]|uniref:Serine acetyltransferase n=1 Tax=Melghirimyces thermohalophilus TaxID=1236220 RepID=A0A1G6PBH8_9BACL|nr:serine O-acetyltransferase [Melghirimyces thermohalophilus]MDA8353455.1 serine O-acetyltransferase [Bacillota bacterium]SDC77620.1 serine O-acetyltransferase [Melghirimyces thermohalophilus]